MQFTHLDNIFIPDDRQRKKMDPGKLSELCASIEKLGLLHPLVVREDMTLVAGERRYSAMEKLHADDVLFSCDGAVVPVMEVPVILLTDLSDIQYLEAELEENIMREELSWQDRVAATDELHKLRIAQNPGQTFIDTAREITSLDGPTEKYVEQQVSRANVVAEYLDDPDVAKAKNERDAFNIVSRKIRGEFADELYRRGKERKTPHTLIQGDLRQRMEEYLVENMFDCIIADPPYGMDAGSFGDAAKNPHRYEDDRIYSMAINNIILEESYRVTKDTAHLYLFCDIEHFRTLKHKAESVGWNVQRTPLVWYKGSSGHIPDGPLGFRRNYELIMFATKGEKKLEQLHSDVLQVAADKEREYAAAKPVALYELLLRLSCKPGDQVLDPCCGSGPIFDAASSFGAIATGIEKDDEAIQLCRIRLNQVKLEDM